MKVAISIPDSVYAEADTLARETGMSRSELYSRAVREYVASHSPDAVTEAMDRLADEVDTANDGFMRAAARAALERIEW